MTCMVSGSRSRISFLTSSRLADPLHASLLSSASALGEIHRVRKEQGLARLSGPLTAADALASSLGTTSHAAMSSVGAFLRLQEEAERQKLTDLATGYSRTIGADVLGAQFKALAEGHELHQLEAAQRALGLLAGSITSASDTHASSTLFNSAPAGVKVVADARRQLGSSNIGMYDDHLEAALQGLLPDKNQALARYGVISAQSLVAVALEEYAGLTALRRDVNAAAALVGVAGLDQSISRLHADVRGEQFRFAGFTDLATRVAQVDRLSAYAFGQPEGLATLASRMERMGTPWLNQLESLSSATAVARLQAIGELVEHAPPFATAVGSWLRTGLGDWRDTVTFDPEGTSAETRESVYSQQGVDASLVATTPLVFVRAAHVAYLFEADRDWAEDWLTAADNELELAEHAYRRLQRFEMAIRQVIAGTMLQACGDRWMRTRLPTGMLDQWKERQKAGATADAQRRELIEYADFTDYLKIIERADNWREAFGRVFGRKEDVKESLQRLYPLRLAIMHARLVTAGDLLLLLSETKRIVQAFNR